MLAQASRKVKGFSEEIQKLKVNLSVDGKSKSTYQNYARHLATLALHFNALPSLLSQEQIKDYLYQLQQSHPTPCESYFKHTVF